MKFRRLLPAAALGAAVLVVAAGCGVAEASAASVNGREVDRTEFEEELRALRNNPTLQRSGGADLLGTGQRTVTARVSAENLTGRPLAVGASENDPFGASGDRDFYVVDAAGRLAYSSSDSMPRQPIPPGATRTVEVRMKGYRDFASTGPFRFTVVVDPRRAQYAIFRTG